MGPTMLRRRRAERFAQLLDEADGSPRHHFRRSFDPELADLVELRRRVGEAAPPVAPAPDFRAQLRAVLVATAHREGIGATARAETSQPSGAARGRLAKMMRNRGSRARMTLIAGVALGTVAFAGISQASEHALPGHPLYGIKRSTERAQLALTASDNGRGQLYLDFARTRLDEASTLTGTLGSTLDDMDQATVAGVSLLTDFAVTGHDPTALALIDDFATEQRKRLDLLAQARSGDRDRITDSMALLDEVVERSGRLRESLSCSSLTIIRVDTLGPLLADCPTEPDPPAYTEPPRRQVVTAPSPQPPGGEPTQTAPSAAPKDSKPTTKPTPGAGNETTAEEDATPSSPAPALPDPDPSLGPTPSQTPVEVEPEEETSGGLLGGLRRLLESLLGG